MGKYVSLTHYVDDNLFHDQLIGSSGMGILHFSNKNRVGWRYDKYNTIQMATYGYEFVSAFTSVKHIIDLSNTLRYLGVSTRQKIYIYGDKKCVVDRSIHPHDKLHKRHTVL